MPEIKIQIYYIYFRRNFEEIPKTLGKKIEYNPKKTE